MMELRTPDARTDLAAFFDGSGVLSGRRLRHTPILAFLHDESVAGSLLITVREFESVTKLLDAGLLSDTPLMCQWPGQWSSDFFRFSVEEIRAAYEART